MASNSIPSQPPLNPSDFAMTVESVFAIRGRGSVATGTIQGGKVQLGQAVTITDPTGETIKTSVTGIEAFRKQLREAETGTQIGLLLKGDNNVVKGSLIKADL